MSRPRRVLIAFSDSGGGHRSAAEALSQALSAAYSGDVHVDLVDGLRAYAPYPMNRLPDWYPLMVGPGARLWAHGFQLTDRPSRVSVINRVTGLLTAGAARRLVDDYRADVVVSVHPLLVTPLARAVSGRAKVITVVTDLVSPHAWWFDPQVQTCVVATAAARRHALRCGVRASHVHMIGLPVDSRFAQIADNHGRDPGSRKTRLRADLGWSPDSKTVTVLAGGEGTGPAFEIARAIAHAGLGCELVVMTGRNAGLRERLASVRWPVSLHAYGFVTHLPDILHASDVVLAKAGPATICEALAAGVPLILYHHIPGQESGNVEYVVSRGAGISAPTPVEAVAAVRAWLVDDDARSRASALARRCGSVAAAPAIARLIWNASSQATG